MMMAQRILLTQLYLNIHLEVYQYIGVNGMLFMINRYFDNEDQAVDYFIQLLNNSSPQFKQFYKEHQDMF